jgi:hypothetical protein
VTFFFIIAQYAQISQMEILPHYYFSWMVCSQKQRYTCEMLPLETKQSGDKLLPHLDLRGGGGEGSVSRGNIQQQAVGSYWITLRKGEDILI